MEGILAIDPAGPIFEDNSELKLGKNDAKAVQALHTNSDNSGLLSGITLGINENLGKVDFYLNGAWVQPGCYQVDVECHHEFGYRFLTDLNKRNVGRKKYRNE